MSDIAPDAAITDPLPVQIAALLDLLGARTAVAARRLAHPPSASMSSAAGVGGESKSLARPPHRRGAAGAVLLRAEVPLPMGALARLGVAVELLRRVDLGHFRLDEVLDELVASPSALMATEVATEYEAVTDESAALTLDAACARMLAADEPAATDAAATLLELVGLGETNETLSRLKLEATHLAREEDGRRATHRVSTTTSGDMLTLLGLLSGNAIPGAARLREILAWQARLHDVREGLPAEAELAHLPAIGGGYAHDVGWLRGPGGGCAFCVLIADVADMDRAIGALIDVPRLLWNAWCAD